ncbi:MAG: Fur family transcriptional regulator [Planctomycetota bacterium]
MTAVPNPDQNAHHSSDARVADATRQQDTAAPSMSEEVSSSDAAAAQARRAPRRIGHRRTEQRNAILAVIRRASGPLTVNEIHQAAVTFAPGLGKATVYRTIRLLEEEHLLQTVVLSDGQSRYERADLDEHSHFHCRVCDRVFDVSAPPPEPEPVQRSIPDGFKVDRSEMNLYGVCSTCDDADTTVPELDAEADASQAPGSESRPATSD